MAQQTGLGGQRQALLTLVQMRQQDLEPRRELITDLHRYAHARIPHQPALTPKTTHYFFTASVDQAALAQAVGEGDLDGADQPGRAVGDHQQR
jgi:hypothetical protein